MHISTNDLHCCKPARLLQRAPSGGRPHRRRAARPPPHPTQRPTSPTATDCVGRPIARRQQTAPPQQRRSKDATAHPQQPGARPDPPRPAPARSGRHRSAKGKVRSPHGPEFSGGVRSGSGEARTIRLLHIISVRPSKQPFMVCTILKVYMELGSYFVPARTNKRHHHERRRRP